MKYSLSGLWQLSPLSDLSVPQDDISFPAALSTVLPGTLSESDIAAQEWHLMHDIEVDDVLLGFAATDLILSGIEYHAEVRLNGVALFDCDSSSTSYRKDIRPLLQAGRNRFEILFLEPDDDWLIDESEDESQVCYLGNHQRERSDPRMGIWQEPYLQCIRHARLTRLATEQIWHHGGGCELLVHIYFDILKPGLLSASVKFDGMIYHIPIDVRTNHASALFQVEAPRYYDPEHPDDEDLYLLTVQLDGQNQTCRIGLSDSLQVLHFPV
ncbi:glycosyl hydrolase 2 galactose-binding domain-containing protein [Vibrio quintilis]|uniref:Beta-mannosidase-like galactose-binding domain-containing protein n=1 Tax=Vibrio quintilis TaxID=1117707 RepID=A0A1M7YSL6_9VIBR|nr:beta-galactosidase [Vibrio quintilis]SHO55612.1 hypothetical protein VQ7734_01349 [Vibrio quintilis]